MLKFNNEQERQAYIVFKYCSKDNFSERSITSIKEKYHLSSKEIEELLSIYYQTRASIEEKEKYEKKFIKEYRKTFYKYLKRLVNSIQKNTKIRSISDDKKYQIETYYKKFATSEEQSEYEEILKEYQYYQTRIYYDNIIFYEILNGNGMSTFTITSLAKMTKTSNEEIIKHFFTYYEEKAQEKERQALKKKILDNLVIQATTEDPYNPETRIDKSFLEYFYQNIAGKKFKKKTKDLLTKYYQINDYNFQNKRIFKYIVKNIDWQDNLDKLSEELHLSKELIKAMVEDYYYHKATEEEKERFEIVSNISNHEPNYLTSLIVYITKKIKEEPSFELLDYYQYTDCPLDLFFNQAKDILSPTNLEILKNFIVRSTSYCDYDYQTQTIRDYKILKLKVKEEIESIDHFLVVQGKNHFVTTTDKQNVIKYLKQNNLPLYRNIYIQALKRYLNNTLPELSSNRLVTKVKKR